MSHLLTHNSSVSVVVYLLFRSLCWQYCRCFVPVLLPLLHLNEELIIIRFVRYEIPILAVSHQNWLWNPFFTSQIHSQFCLVYIKETFQIRWNLHTMMFGFWRYFIQSPCISWVVTDLFCSIGLESSFW